MSQYFITVFLVSDIIFVHVAWYKVWTAVLSNWKQ
jgi:hypothetical protein